MSAATPAAFGAPDPRVRPWLLGATLVVAANMLYQHALWSMVDFAVYRLGGHHLATGEPLYRAGGALPFTYPPFAAVLFDPLARMSVDVGQVLMIVLSTGCYLGFVLVCAHESGLSRSATWMALVGGLLYEPVLHTLGLGQVNLLLGLLIALDCLVVSPRWRGLLVGLAIGIKLTPLVFVLFFVLQRDVRAIGRAALGFTFTLLLAWALDPADSRLFWTKLFYDPGHVGRVGYPYNQGVYGALARALHTMSPSFVLYAGCAALLSGLAAYAAHMQLRRANRLGALVAVAVLGLLVSPVSWTHHWIWLLPAGWLLVGARRFVAAAFVIAVPVVSPLRYIPTPKNLSDLHLVWWQTALSLSYTLAGLVVLVVMALPERRARQPLPDPASAGSAP